MGGQDQLEKSGSGVAREVLKTSKAPAIKPKTR